MGNETSDIETSEPENDEPSFGYPVQKQSSIRQKLLKIKQMNPTKYIASPRWSYSNTKSNTNLNLPLPIPHSTQYSSNPNNDCYASDSDTSMTMTTPITPSISLNDSGGANLVLKYQKSRVNKSSQRVISDKMAEIAANFWCNNIESASVKQRLEIACSIWFGMMAGSSQIRHFLTSRFKKNDKLETAALRNLDMIGFIIRGLYTSNNNMPSLLYKLGTLHIKMGIKIEHFDIMLQQLHETFKFYYPLQYTTQVEFCVEEIFIFAAQAMTGKDLKLSSILHDTSFLRSLRYCIADKIGSKYLYRFLHQRYCDEMVMFLYLLSLYKKTSKDPQLRYIIAKDICSNCIEAEGPFSINIAYDLRERILMGMDKYETIEIGMDFFIDVEDQICRLIGQTHWKKFQSHVSQLYLVNVTNE